MDPPDPVFVDTNVLVFASRPKADEHEAARGTLARLRQRMTPLWLSSQVLREYLAASTRPQRSGPAFAMADAIADVQASMLGDGIARLLTFNAADFRRFEPAIEIIVP